MSNHDPEFPLAVRHSMIANDEQSDLTPNRRTLADTGELHDLSDRDLMGYEKLATFGSFILDCEESENFTVLSDIIEDDGQRISMAMNAGQAGLGALEHRSSLDLWDGVSCKDLTGFSASCIAKDMLEDDTGESPVVFAAGVEVYESPDKERVLPVLAYNKLLGYLAYKTRNHLPFGTTEHDSLDYRHILEPSKETKDLLIIEAVADLLPSDLQQYYRI